MSTSTITGPGIDEATIRPAETRSIEDPSKPITAAMLADILSGGNGTGSQVVSPTTSMRVAAVWACVWTISAAIARMPLVTYERTNSGRERAKKHPLYMLLRMRPNPDMSAYSFMRALMCNVLLWGNGYAEIVRNPLGDITALLPIEAYRVTPVRVGGELMYDVMVDGQPVRMLKRDILHVPGLSFNGITGISVIANARQTIGASLSADNYSEGLMRNGLRPGGVLEHPGRLGTEGTKNLRESLQATYGGPGNSGKPMILEEGMKWQAMTMPLEDAQFIESAYFRIEEICRWFNVPPQKIQHLLRATNNNIEQLSLDWLSDTVAPWSEAIQQEVNWKLFTAEELDVFYAEFLTQVLVQMDATTRGNFYGKLFGIGAMSPDEVRERENMNDLPEKRGEVYYIPSNMMPAPTPDEAGKLLEAFVAKAAAGKTPGTPQPQADSKVAGQQ